MAKRTALITGASAGIGLALAQVFAQQGHDLILVARREDKLNALAADLKAKHGTQSTVIAMDLTADGAAAALFADLERRKLTVDMLVNNAGFATYGLFAETEVDADLQLLHLNIVTLTHLTKLLLPGMKARRYGKIMNLGSTGSFTPGPLTAIYCASKAFVLSLSEALACELRGTGVTVTALCPGATKSEFQAVAKMEKSRIVRGGMMSAEAVAEIGYRGLMRGKTIVIPGATNRLLPIFARIVPRFVLPHLAMYVQQTVGH